MTLDATFRPLASKLLTKFGRGAIYTRVVAGVYDPATGAATNTETEHSVYTYQNTPNDSQLASGQYTASNSIFLLSAEQLGFVPRPNDKITAGSVWTIERVRKYSSGAQDALYECVANQ